MYRQWAAPDEGSPWKPSPTLSNAAPAPRDNSLRANGNVYINAGKPLGNNAIAATVVLQNTSDQNADDITTGRATGADAHPEFGGEIAVSPRLSNTAFTDKPNRKKFYVVVSGDSSHRG